MKKGDKRGLSTVVATLLIILLVIVAVGIVWTVIRTVINNNAQQVSLGKFTINLQIVSIKQTAQDVNIKVKRNAGEGTLKGIVFSIFDGKNTHIYEKNNITLNPLEIKTFVVDYQGKIVSVSIYPIIETSPGKIITGNLADTYYVTSTGEQVISQNCTSNCNNKECGDNGCGAVCGTCSGSTPNCNAQGQCTAEQVGSPNCSCSANTCTGTTCSNGIGGSCDGLLQPDCNNNQIMCGDSLNSCGSCGTCDTGYYCNGGICSPNCDPVANCLGKNCGSDGCGGICGTCNLPPFGPTFNCNASQLCEECIPNCGARECGAVPNGCGNPLIGCGNCTLLHNESYNCNFNNFLCEMCTPECNGKVCGNSSNGCGECGTGCTGQDICIDGSCIPPETVLNIGTVNSIWPINVGIYFDSGDLPKSGVNYNGYWVKFPGSLEFNCLQIDRFVIPVMPEIYNMSYIKFIQTSSDIQPGNTYEIWETYEGCTS